jgi:hypothetical protein
LTFDSFLRSQGTGLHCLKSFHNVELTVDDLGEIESAASKIKVEGARYPEKLEQLAGR